eukprot:CAMPEP_0184488478 /NCGR_PEP_ID=MMETSP0113_2-20130426/12174_1 /TAXON_ID=91329 /ORGANISM="Norrisiella sphaerica, Strain BC52" /LENGTH=366 /DNA_ID=CAMNT_0026871301 /DNA_START=97 /DNA_END=1194 /DNA_ORIENTATION=-
MASKLASKSGESSLKKVLREHATKKLAPACSAAMVYKGEIMYMTAAGVTLSSDRHIPATPDETVFMIASLSKPILAVLALQCRKRYSLDLDRDINKYLPRECSVNHPRYPETPISCRHLLTHKSGLADDEAALVRGSDWRTENKDFPSSLKEYVSKRLHNSSSNLWSQGTAPGQAKYHYSNAGMTLLGYVLECVGSDSLQNLAAKFIFLPLSMNHTAYFLSDFKSWQTQAKASGKLAPPTEINGYNHHYGVAEFPAAGLRSTAKDMATFLSVFTEQSLRKWTNSLKLSQADMKEMLPRNFKSGLAWWGGDTWYGEKSNDVWSHGGFMPGVRAHIFLWPEKKVGSVFLSNGEGDYGKISSTMFKLKD